MVRDLILGKGSDTVVVEAGVGVVVKSGVVVVAVETGADCC